MKISTYLLAFAICGGCGKKGPPAPYTGPLDVTRLMSAKDLVHPFTPWDEGFATLQNKLGKPTKVDGMKYTWAVMTGDDCAYMVVEEADGKEYKKEGMMVGTVQSPMTVAKDGPDWNRADCLKAVGKK